MIDNDSYNWFSIFFDSTILECIRKFMASEYNIRCNIDRPEELKNKIYLNYVNFRDFCKNRYMLDHTKDLDRHKVIACIVFAIIKTQPLQYCSTLAADEFTVYNEHLAINCGFSLHRATLLAVFDKKIKDGEISKEKGEKYKEKITQRGIIVPTRINHGESYLGNFAIQLHYNMVENCFDILGMANSLFLLELYTLNIIESELMEGSSNLNHQCSI